MELTPFSWRNLSLNEPSTCPFAGTTSGAPSLIRPTSLGDTVRAGQSPARQDIVGNDLAQRFCSVHTGEELEQKPKDCSYVRIARTQQRTVAHQ